MATGFLTSSVLKSQVSRRARRQLTICSSRGGINTVKICGIHTPEDARMVVEEAKNLLPEELSLMLGMIMWPGSKRHVPIDVASEIACVAKEAEIPSVGVFVDEDASTMTAARDGAGSKELKDSSSKDVLY
uniref:Phosphoribosylanthranilate isomerase n=1 Tax=Rhodosorus marinus TaxID=101924 RepID=A0A7S0BKI0_9RHOD|mmetsp:Transcript_2097/g.3113  ORF Transcript_2097/g.3113 Transcript_2097/m.3113 type:complete len:131 (+) Transcript_2097:214-606(+)